MSASGLLIVGAGGHAQACIDVVERSGAFLEIGFIGMAQEVGRDVFGHAVIGTDEDLSALVVRFPEALVGIGQIRSAAPRMAAYERLLAHGFVLPTIISPLAMVSRHAEIGEGSIVMNGALIGPGVRIGRNCIVNSGALIEHGCRVEDHCHISTHAVLNGEVQVGAGSFVGSASVVKERVVIGRGCLVGMGSRLRKDLADGSLYY